MDIMKNWLKANTRTGFTVMQSLKPGITKCHITGLRHRKYHYVVLYHKIDIISIYCIIAQPLLWLMSPYPRTISSPYLTGTLVEGRLEEMFSCSGENIRLLRLELRKTDVWGEPDQGGHSSRRRRKKRRKESWASALPSPAHGSGRIPVLSVTPVFLQEGERRADMSGGL